MIKREVGVMLKRFNYTKSEGGEITDDENVKESENNIVMEMRGCGKGIKDIKYGYHMDTYNDKVMKYVTSNTYGDASEKPTLMINRKFDLLGVGTEQDKGGGGSRTFKQKIRGNVGVIAPDGTLVSGPGMPLKEESKEGEPKEGESKDVPKEEKSDE